VIDFEIVGLDPHELFLLGVIFSIAYTIGGGLGQLLADGVRWLLRASKTCFVCGRRIRGNGNYILWDGRRVDWHIAHEGQGVIDRALQIVKGT